MCCPALPSEPTLTSLLQTGFLCLVPALAAFQSVSFLYNRAGHCLQGHLHVCSSKRCVGNSAFYCSGWLFQLWEMNQAVLACAQTACHVSNQQGGHAGGVCIAPGECALHPS